MARAHHPRRAQRGRCGVSEAPEERAGRVWYQSWAGLTSTRVLVIGETPKRYRVRFVDGTVRLVPKRAVTFDTNGAT